MTRPLRLATAADLLLVDFESVAILHVELNQVSNCSTSCSARKAEAPRVILAYRVWVVLCCDALSVEEEAHA